MKNLQLNLSPGRIMTYAGLAIVSLPLYIYILWIYSTIKVPDNIMAIQLFRSLLPGFLGHDETAALVSFLLSLAGLTLGIAGIRMNMACMKLNTILIVTSGIMAFLNLFQLL